ncbi:MAG: class I SAM-dependent methyltransferase [Synergistaceae bacterium]|jgi:SAM-dependent methyltransferase|nr:class I SAM-dependent methyltransferase [Synergistaceae bacterium]
MSVFGDYSKYYDLLYRDKDYEAEARYVDALIKKYGHNARSMLELGCGTGRYTREFSRLGYAVHGVDFSEDMLTEAREKSENVEGLRFSYGDMRSVRLGEKFDVVAALFHVLSYQTTNQDVLDAFTTVKEHLAPEGIAVLDFWYGPAVLTQQPEVRIKEVSNDKLQITRIARPELCPNENLVEVNYDAFIDFKAENRIDKIRECHHMRYFFICDLALICNIIPLEILSIEEWMTGNEPSVNSWAVVAVLR